ncbi:hypothetical protein CEXT_327061 [Caerostris extrusa]|uniref:Uncharacterized protein n=1 Tax=Caerostris extrusa TaxID=172846 RepID=A0AAV4SVE5_CAEEX|nr:hypothetical protein CEXT_327061 [Caerostris extrusa]
MARRTTLLPPPPPLPSRSVCRRVLIHSFGIDVQPFLLQAGMLLSPFHFHRRDLCWLRTVLRCLGVWRPFSIPRNVRRLTGCDEFKSTQSRHIDVTTCQKPE